MAANITSCHGRDGDLTVNLCYKQQLLEGARQGIRCKSSFLKIVHSVNGNSIRKIQTHLLFIVTRSPMPH